MQRKIVHILLGKANPERQNGVNKVVFELASVQQEQGAEVEVWGITRNVEINFKERSFTTRLFKDNSWKFFVSRRLNAAITESNAETMFHLHGGFLPQLFRVAGMLRRNEREYVFTPHGAYNSQAMLRSAWKKKVYLFLFERHVVKNASFVHVIGESEIAGTKQVFGSGVRTELIPNGHHLSSRNVIRSQSGDLVHFGFMGRLDLETKGLDILIKGFAKALDIGGKGKLHIAGDGNDFETLQRLSRQYGVSEALEFHGALFGEKKKRFFESLHYFCLTSRNEGLPGVVLEAMDNELPCIVSHETNLGRAISSANAGWVLPENNANCLSEAITEAVLKMKSEEYKIKAKNARELVRGEFDWAKISNRLIAKFYAA